MFATMVGRIPVVACSVGRASPAWVSADSVFLRYRLQYLSRGPEGEVRHNGGAAAGGDARL